MVYYRYLFKNLKRLSPNEGIVYSALLANSLFSSEHFSLDGSFSAEFAKAFIRENVETQGDECITYHPIPTRKLAKLLKMAEKTVREIKDDLEFKHHLIRKEKILCPMELLDMGYIDVDPETGLKGLQLLFYALLKDRSYHLHGTIDTWAVRLAEIMGLGTDEKAKKSVHNLLSALSKRGLVKRLPDGKLRIL